MIRNIFRKIVGAFTAKPDTYTPRQYPKFEDRPAPKTWRRIFSIQRRNPNRPKSLAVLKRRQANKRARIARRIQRAA